jgi:hypothetical protein
VNALGQPVNVAPLGLRILREDLASPTEVSIRAPGREEVAVNRGRMYVSEALQRRIRIRVNPEVFVKLTGAKWNYHRLTRCFSQLSFPNHRQAELFCDALLKFCASFDGVLLCDDGHCVDSKDLK